MIRPVRTRILLIAMAAALLAPPAARACTIGVSPGPQPHPFETAYGAVLGRITSRVLVADQSPADRTYRYRMRVLERYKGRVPDWIELVGSTNEGMCGAGELGVGRRYRVLLRGRRSSPWRIDILSFFSRRDAATWERRRG